MEDSRTIFIYTLTNPFTNEIYYVGQTVDMGKRVLGHKKIKHEREHKYPIIEEIDRCEYNERLFVEKYWINQLYAWGFPLVNSISGLRWNRSDKAFCRETYYNLPMRLNKPTLDAMLHNQEIIKKLSAYYERPIRSIKIMIRYNDARLTRKIVLQFLANRLNVDDTDKLLNKAA